jgi:hypothetical protein
MKIAVIVWVCLFVGAMIGMYITKDKRMKAQPVDLKNGDTIKITDLPPCINGRYSPNPYIGMYGVVYDFDGETFSILTETSWLVGIKIKTCKFIKL